MQLIDWPNLFANTLWIVALAALLTTVGYAWWETGTHRESLRHRLANPAYQVLLNLEGALFCAGAGLTENRPWAQVLWGLLSAAFLWQAYVQKRNAR